MIAKEIRAHSAQKLKGISLGYNMRSTAPRRNHKNKSTVCLWILSAFWMTLRAAYGQGNFYEFGICACTPNRYDFRLDFSLKCPTTEELELVLEDGVVTAECAVVPTKPGEKIADLMPASAQSLEITELRQDNSIAVQESIEGDFLDGDAFRYVSFAETLEEIQEANDIPKTLQFTIQGKNRNGEKITNVVVIEFNNDCDSYPVIRSNNTAGWIRFVSTRYASSQQRNSVLEYCRSLTYCIS